MNSTLLSEGAELNGKLSLPKEALECSMDVRELVRQIGNKEPLNPYQVAGMAEVIRRSGATIEDGATLVAEDLGRVLMILDRTGEQAA